jgi:tRNA modification GTPase
MFERIDDTIVAISTPAGSGPRGMVRLSGAQARSIADQMFQADDGRRASAVETPARLTGRLALSPGRFLVPVELYVFAEPRSYTRENVVEVHSAGGAALLQMIVQRTLELGARPAAAGEFTARAFLRGRLDVGAVQAVAALIRARSDGQVRAAQRWLTGRAAARLRAMREELLGLLALVEADIDFAEEAIEFIQPEELQRRIGDLLAGMAEAAHDPGGAETADRLPRALLVGRTNAGKSTLLNRLSGINRALCSPLAGCTRDFLCATVRLSDGEIELVDTPGWGPEGPESGGPSAFFFERELRCADLVCHVVDLSEERLAVYPEAAQQSVGAPVLWVANKTDLLAEEVCRSRVAELANRLGQRVCAVSAHTGDGIDGLREALAARVTPHTEVNGEQCLATSAVQRQALRDASAALRRAEQACRGRARILDSAEYLACDLRGAGQALGTLFGEVTTDDLLRRIFDGFCIGK